MAIPTSPVVTAIVTDVGRIVVFPSSSGDAATSYTIQIATDAGFTANVRTQSSSDTAKTSGSAFAGLNHATTYYARTSATNNSGTSAYSAGVSATTPPSDVMTGVEDASVVVDDVTVSLRNDGGATPVITLGYSPLTGGTAWTQIAVVPTTLATDFGLKNQRNDFALVADPAGNLFLIGHRGSGAEILIKRYARTGPTTWVASGSSYQQIAADVPLAFTAAYVAGSGGSPRPSILLIAGRLSLSGMEGNTGQAARPHWATIDPAVVEASGATPFISSGVAPTWLSTDAASSIEWQERRDLVPLVAGGNKLAHVTSNGADVITSVNGATPTRSATIAVTSLRKVRVVAIDANTFAIMGAFGPSLTVRFCTTSGTVLGTTNYAAANLQGALSTDQWDAIYDPIAAVVRLYYIADDSTRKVERVDISRSTYLASAAVTVSSTLGAVGSTNAKLRMARGLVDERRSLIEVANLASGTKSYAVISDTAGNVAPNAPVLTNPSSNGGYDATAAKVVVWAFGDNNPLDSQTAYELEIQRVSDSVVIVSTGKIVSATSSRTIAANTLVNGVSYRWRVRTYDELDVVGSWSAYDTFTTAALGTLTITQPPADTTALDVATYTVQWSYVQANGYLQTQRRVKVVKVSDSTTLSDTGMQASTATSHLVSLPTGVPVRIEVSVVTNAPGTPTVGPTNRLVTSNYSDPMTPTLAATVGESYIALAVTNPTPSGSRPEVAANYIERRETDSGADFVTVAVVGHNGSYNDHAVRSSTSYDYRVRGVTA